MSFLHALRTTQACFAQLAFALLAFCYCISIQAAEPSITHTTQKSSCISLHEVSASANPQVLYIWSPRMVSSVLEAAQAARAARESGAQFVAALDPRVSTEEAQAALTRAPQAQGLLASAVTLCADAEESHALAHAPILFVIAHNKRHPHRIIGVMPEAAWREAISLRLSDLRSAN